MGFKSVPATLPTGARIPHQEHAIIERDKRSKDYSTMGPHSDWHDAKREMKDGWREAKREMKHQWHAMKHQWHQEQGAHQDGQQQQHQHGHNHWMQHGWHGMNRMHSWGRGWGRGGMGGGWLLGLGLLFLLIVGFKGFGILLLLGIALFFLAPKMGMWRMMQYSGNGNPDGWKAKHGDWGNGGTSDDEKPKRSEGDAPAPKPKRDDGIEYV